MGHKAVVYKEYDIVELACDITTENSLRSWLIKRVDDDGVIAKKGTWVEVRMDLRKFPITTDKGIITCMVRDYHTGNYLFVNDSVLCEATVKDETVKEVKKVFKNLESTFENMGYIAQKSENIAQKAKTKTHTAKKTSKKVKKVADVVDNGTTAKKASPAISLSKHKKDNVKLTFLVYGDTKDKLEKFCKANKVPYSEGVRLLFNKVLTSDYNNMEIKQHFAKVDNKVRLSVVFPSDMYRKFDDFCIKNHLGISEGIRLFLYEALK